MEDDDNNGWDLPPPQCGTKDFDNDDCRNQGNNRRATMMAVPSASPAADTNNIKDEDARETNEDDSNDKMSGTNKVGRIGATPANPHHPHPCCQVGGSGHTACRPMQ